MRRSPLIQLSFFLLLAVPILSVVLGPPQARADQWTNLAGTSTISGEMLGLWNGRVLLRLDSGRRVSVRLEDLRADSRIQAEKRLAELKERLQERRDEIVAVAKAEEAPAPSESPDISPAPSYQMPELGEDLQSAIISQRDQILAGHPRVLFDMLPESLQKQIDELATAALMKLNPSSYESARATLQGLADLIISRQRWLFSHPRLAQLPETQQEAIVGTALLVGAITADDVSSLQLLRSRRLSETFVKLDEALAPYIHTLLAEHAATAVELFDFEVEPGANGTMIAKFNAPLVGTVSSNPYTLVEGRWVEQEGAEAFSKRMQEARKSLEAIPDDSLRLPPAAESILAQINASVSVLRQAPTRQDFHRELDGVLEQLATALNGWSGFQLPARGGIAGRPAQGGYGSESGSADVGDSPADSADYSGDYNSYNP